MFLNLREQLCRNLQTMTVEEYQKYVNEADLGYIRINKHPEDENLVILNYTEITTFEKRWNEQTRASRGLILDLTDAKDNGKIYILAKPFDKFPNYGENPEYEEDIDLTQIEYIMEKMDGSLGISYFFKNEIRFATRGSFSSDQAIRATKIWGEKYSHKLHRSVYINNPYTMLVEIIYPENRVVVNYDGQEDLVLLGVRDIHTSKSRDEFDLEQLKKFSYLMNMPMAGIYEIDSVDELLAKKDNLSANEEGWVVKFTNGKRLKIKGSQYLHVHRLLHGVSDKAKFRAWATGEMTEYIIMLPEEFRPELEEFAENLDKLKDSIFTLMQTMYEIVEMKTYDKKSFALMVNDVIQKEYRKFMFDAYNKKVVSVELIREHIADNYIEYLEVINSWNKQDS